MLNIIHEYLFNKYTRSQVFRIIEIEEYLIYYFSENFFIETMNPKCDIYMVFSDKKKIQRVSIKSNIWYPSTILNASNLTFFKYKINGLNEEEIIEFNSINTSTKVIDKIQYLKNKSCKVKMCGAISYKFKKNLNIIDDSAEKIFSKLLLFSYLYMEKKLSLLIEKLSNLEKMKLENILLNILFNALPSNYRYDSYVDIILFIDESGIVIYNKSINELGKLLLKNLKIETPSTKKYHYPYIKKTFDNENYFELVLQIRFIRKKYKNIDKRLDNNYN